MKRLALILARFAVIFAFSSCGKKVTDVEDANSLVGKWTLVELETHRGNRGPATGIMEAEINFSADGTSSAFLVINKQFAKTEEIRTNFTGKWSLSNSALVTIQGANTTSTVSRIWFEGDLLKVNSGGGPLMYYYSRVE